jgi:phage terminase large subunit GpA-like protein
MRFDWRNLRYEPQKPHNAYHVSPCCGGVTQHWQKRQCIAAGRFVAERAAPGLMRTFHLDALSSNLTTWDKAVETFLAAGDDPQKLKAFFNLWLGLPYEEKGDAPEWQALYKRREPYAQLMVPDWCLYTTAFADVQKRGIWLETVGWGADRRSLPLDARFIAGNPEDPEDRVWKELAEHRHRPLPMANGRVCDIDIMGVDSGYLAANVYDFVRKQPNVLACKGEGGWGRPALASPVVQDYDWRGKRIKRGVMLWKVGTFGLKSRHYAYLRRETEVKDGEIVFPAGYCHFGSWLDEEYFRQITAEYVGVDARTGNRVWKVRDEQNHFLDCRVGNLALAFGYLMIDRLTDDQWRRRAAERGARDEALAGLFTAPTPETAPAEPEPAQPPPPAAEQWVRVPESWI